MPTIHQRSDGRYVAVDFFPTKGRFRTTMTKDFHPVEATSVDDLDCRSYKSLESLSRALRKFKDRL
jgi:hypothetical protein